MITFIHSSTSTQNDRSIHDSLGTLIAEYYAYIYYYYLYDVFVRYQENHLIYICYWFELNLHRRFSLISRAVESFFGRNCLAPDQ